MKPQNKLTLEQLTNRGFVLVGKSYTGLEAYHSYQEQHGIIVKPVNGQYRITNQYPITSLWNVENTTSKEEPKSIIQCFEKKHIINNLYECRFKLNCDSQLDYGNGKFCRYEITRKRD